MTLEVRADGTLNVREAITFDFKGSHQGIFRTIPVRYERRGEIHHALLTLGCCLVCFRRLRNSF